MRLKLAILSLFFVVQAFSQQLVTGKILDADTKEPLIGAHVYLLKNWRKGAVTDIDGRFELQLQREDVQHDSLIVSYIGFKETVLPVEGGLTVFLEPIETKGETVVVTAKPLIAEEFKYVEIKKIEIYTNPAAKADPILAVNSLPSATTTDESANISLRGSSPIETGVFFNNVPIYDAVRYSQLNGIGTFSIFNTDIIKSVTVFPGNPPLEFGNATSGIISMQTDDRILEDNTNSLILSLANIGFSRQQKLNGKSNMKLFSNWQPSGAIKALNQEALEDIESFTSNDLGLYWYGNSGISWKILAYGVTEGYQFNFRHPSFNGIFNQQKQRGFLIGSFDQSVGTGTLSLNTGYSVSNGDYSYSNVAFNTRKRDVFIGVNYLLAKERYSLKLGFSYDHRYATVVGSFHQLGYALGEDHPTIDLDETASIKVPEIYAYFKYFFSDKIALGTGLRKNIATEDIANYLSNQANVSYSDNNWTVTFGAGVYHKNGLIENTGEPFETKSEQKSLDVKRKRGGLEIALSLFDKRGEVNEEEYMARGIEIFTDYRFNSNLRASGSVTLLDATSDSEGYLYDLDYFVRGNISWNPAKFWTIESTLVARQGTSELLYSAALYNEQLDVY